MLFDSALRKDLSRTFGAAVTVLLTIVVTILLIRTLGQASRVPGVTPAAVSLLLVHLKKGRLSGRAVHASPQAA